jgi:hypothetical protein
MRCSREIVCKGRLDVGLATLGCAGVLTGADFTVVLVDSALLGDADRGDFFFAAVFFWVVLAFLAVFLRAAAFVTRAFFRFPPALRLALPLVAIAASPNADSALTHS